MALGPVSRILFPPNESGFDRHFSHAHLAVSLARLTRFHEWIRLQHTRGCWAGRPATYFALHRTGFFVPPTSPSARWALTPPFHHYCRSSGRRLRDRLSFSSCLFSVTLSVNAP